MATILLAVALVAVLFAAMAIGVMFGRQPIKGSCGGMSALGMKGDCEICGGDRNKCEEASRESSPENGGGTVRRFYPRE
jgi:hypothetical protein